MKCYNHPIIDAVALCKYCSRALCHDCVKEVGKSCSCKDRCETEVAAVEELLQRGRTAYQKTSSTHARTGLFTLLLGLAFMVVGALTSSRSGPNYFLLIMGFIFTAWGISQFVTAKRWKEK
jgi:hypothetical protein